MVIYVLHGCAASLSELFYKKQLLVDIQAKNKSKKNKKKDKTQPKPKDKAEEGKDKDEKERIKDLDCVFNIVQHLVAQAISDASSKIKWAVDLKPNLANLSATKITY